MEVEAKKDRRQRLWEMLVQHGLINQNQLKEAMKVQSQTGDRIGSTLVYLGYIDIDKLLEFLEGNSVSRLQISISLISSPQLSTSSPSIR